MSEKKKITKQFPKELLQQIVWSEAPDEYEKIEDEIIDNTRWSIIHNMIFSFEGKFYSSSYSVGATESQDERPYQYDNDMVECFEVQPTEKTITVYTQKYE